MPTLREQFKVPFGPWEDSLVLHPKLRTTVLRTLELRRLDLRCNGSPIGLNESELYGDDAFRRGGLSRKPVQFSGLFAVRDIWTDLSDTGRKLLKAEINERFPGVNLSNLPKNCPPIIHITGNKHMTVRYLMSDGRWVPDGLFFQSEDRRRAFEVKSMTATTYGLSRKYLSRFFFRRVLEDTLEEDPSPPNVDDRGLTYFLNRLTAQLKDHGPELSADAPDNDHHESGITIGLLGQPRRLQANTAEEVEEQFITHGQWLLKHEQTKRITDSRLFNTSKWQHGLRKLRRKASLSINDDSDDSTGPVTVVQRRNKARTAQLPDETNAEDEDGLGYNYHTDESASSSPAYTSTSSDGDDHPVHDPELLKLIPRWGTDFAPAPTWSDDRQWHCPQRACHYVIDITQLGRTERELLHGRDTRWLVYLNAKKWFWNEPLILHMLKLLVTNHWKSHLAEVDIRQTHVKGRRGKRTWVRYEWIHEDAHRLWPPKDDTRIKEEIWE